MDYAAMGRRIRKRRKALRMTQERLSEKAGVSVSFIGHVERGTRKASLETLINVAQALDLSPNEILCDSLRIVGNHTEDTFMIEIFEIIQRWKT